jgi:hypothetical protein
MKPCLFQYLRLLQESVHVLRVEYLMASLDFLINRYEISVFDCEKPIRILLEGGCSIHRLSHPVTMNGTKSIIIQLIKAEKGQEEGYLINAFGLEADKLSDFPEGAA